ncbi:hypothetical protein ASE04_18845 [Rhizobium sp. Root708]|nr:hypothetical protein ASE04_18845 [Rhizobium sp. Root708]
MTRAPDLTGKTILVVEDDYYVASDTAAALRAREQSSSGRLRLQRTHSVFLRMRRRQPPYLTLIWELAARSSDCAPSRRARDTVSFLHRI